MTVRFNIVAYKSVGDKYPSVHLAIASNRVKRLVKNLKSLGYGTISVSEIEDETVRTVLTGGLGRAKR